MISSLERTTSGILIKRTQSPESLKYHPYSVPFTTYRWGEKMSEGYDSRIFLPDGHTRVVIRGEIVDLDGAAEEAEKRVEIVLPDTIIEPVVIDLSPGRVQITTEPLEMIRALEAEDIQPFERITLGSDVFGRRWRGRFFSLIGSLPG